MKHYERYKESMTFTCIRCNVRIVSRFHTDNCIECKNKWSHTVTTREEYERTNFPI